MCLLFVAAGLDGKPQVAVWAIALASDLLGPYVGRARGWHLSPGHFVERHGLIVIIALGESIVALGAGATSDLDAGVIVAALLGFAVAACLWWAYFDVVAIVAERRLTETEGNAQLAMARDSYSYLHLPMVAGIILFAVGVKKTMGHVGDPLEIVPGRCAVRRCRALPPGARALPAPQHALPQPAASRRQRRAGGARAGRGRAARPRHARRSSPRSVSA